MLQRSVILCLKGAWLVTLVLTSLVIAAAFYGYVTNRPAKTFAAVEQCGPVISAEASWLLRADGISAASLTVTTPFGSAEVPPDLAPGRPEVIAYGGVHACIFNGRVTRLHYPSKV